MEIKGTLEYHGDGIITNNNFWDCDCKENYIHLATIKKCHKCGREEEESPSSRQNEIEDYFKDLLYFHEDSIKRDLIIQGKINIREEVE